MCTFSGGINITFIGTLLDVVEDPAMIVNITNITSEIVIRKYTTVSVCHTAAVNSVGSIRVYK